MSAHSSLVPSPHEGASSVIQPNIRTSKRRVVAKSNRKRALFSCDRCKMKKIACQRMVENGVAHDSKTPCIHCKKMKVECKTTIKRKQRVHGPIENIGLHYKCLVTIMKGLYPDKDVNNIDTLIDLGDSLGMKMPSRYGITKEEEEDLKDIAMLLTSGKKMKHLKENEDEIEIDQEEEQEIDSKVPNGRNLEHKVSNEAQDQKNTERVIVDHGGNPHYIGPLGAPAMATTAFTIIQRNAPKNASLISISRIQKSDSHKEGIINSKQAPLSSYLFKSLDLDHFPLLNLLSKKEADYYVKVFFEKIHPALYCFVEDEFIKSHETLWGTLSNMSKSNRLRLSNSHICSIYMVWILGCQVSPYHESPDMEGPMEFDEYAIARYIDVIKLTLSEIVLTPTLDGIRCLILLSIYMDNNKRRESGYVLVEVAARQAVSLGLNKRSLSAHFQSPIKIQELRRTWWVLFKNELRFSNQMGRPTCLQIEDINQDLPAFQDPVYQAYVEEEVKLNKIMYGVLQYRKKLFLNYELLSLVNVEKAINLKKSFNQWLEELPEALNYYVNPTLYKCGLHLQYHYYFVTLSLPFILYSSVRNNLRLSNDDPILDIICQCVKSSMAIAELMTFIDNNGFFNGTINVDLFYCYHATMALVLIYLLLDKTNRFDLVYIEKTYGITLSVVNDSLQLIKFMNMKNFELIKGTLVTISELIDILIGDLEIIIRSKSMFPDTPGSVEPQLNEAGQPILLQHPDHHHTQQQPIGNSFKQEADTPNSPYAQQAGGSSLIQNPGNNNYDFDLNFAADNQMVLDSDMIDLLFGNRGVSW